MNILLLGSNGQVGQEIKQIISKSLYNLFSFGSSELNILDTEALREAFLESKPDIVINAAAYTNVANSEINIDHAKNVNGLALEGISILCNEYNAMLIHLSTDYVFDGRKQTPYKETDTCNPLNQYGISKLLGEKIISDLCLKHIILRISWVFGASGNNFVKTMLSISSQDQITVVNNEFGSPTSSKSVAKVILKILNHLEDKKPFSYGIYHYRNSPKTSWYNFAVKIFKLSYEYKIIERPPKIKGIPSNEYKTSLNRPRDSFMNINKIKTTFVLEDTNWNEELENLIKLISDEKSIKN